MDANRFDALTKDLITGLGRRRMLSGLLSGGLAGLLAGLETDARPKDRRGKRQRGKRAHDRDRRDQGAATSNDVSVDKKKKKPKKTTICHQGQTLKVTKKKLKAHLKHGDTRGACSPPPPPPPPPPRSSACPEEPFQQCMEPANAAFIAAIEPCRPQCEGDVESAACQACIAPAIEAAVVAAEACAAEVCQVGLGSAEGGTQGARRGGVVAEAAPAGKSCNQENLDACMTLAALNLARCLGFNAVVPCLLASTNPVLAVACAKALADCSIQMALATAACSVLQGCGLKGWCTASNVCCPDRFDIGCNGMCCDADACEACVNGACVGCTPPAVCKGLVNQTCECPEFSEPCGGTRDRPNDCCTISDIPGGNSETCCGETCCAGDEHCCQQTTCCKFSEDCVGAECKPRCDQCAPRDRTSGICTPTDDIWCAINPNTPEQRNGFCCEDECLDFFAEFGAGEDDEHCGGCGIACGSGSCCVEMCIGGQPCRGCNEWHGGIGVGGASQPACGDCTFEGDQWECPGVGANKFYSCTGKPCTTDAGFTSCCNTRYPDGRKGVCTNLDGCCPEDRVQTISSGPQAGKTFCQR